MAYEFRGADELICDFFTAVEAACQREAVPFEFELEDVEMDVELEDEADDTQILD